MHYLNIRQVRTLADYVARVGDYHFARARGLTDPVRQSLRQRADRALERCHRAGIDQEQLEILMNESSDAFNAEYARGDNNLERKHGSGKEVT